MKCVSTFGGGGYNWKFSPKVSPEPITDKDVEENKKMRLNYQVIISTFVEKEMYSPNPTFGKRRRCFSITDLG